MVIKSEPMASKSQSDSTTTATTQATSSTKRSIFQIESVCKSIPRNYSPSTGTESSQSRRRTATLKTSSQQHSERIFGLPDAPTLYPTEKEFKDPLEYISSISQEYKKYGIIKIVPPSTWKPPFAVDTKTFTFQTRKQTISSMNIHSRPTLNYYQSLTKFHLNQGTILKPPILERRHVDLLQLKKVVQEYGGAELVTQEKKWADIGRECGFSTKTCTSLSHSMKTVYTKWIQPFEEYLEKAKLQPPTRDVTPASSSSNHMVIDESTESFPSSTENHTHDESSMSKCDSIPSTPLSALSSPSTLSSISEEMRSGSPAAISSRMHRSGRPARMAAVSAYKRVSASLQKPGAQCVKCRRQGSSRDPLAVCEDCGDGFHLNCVNPPLQAVPRGWYCPTCIKTTGDDFGFEDGGEYTLATFQKVADDFKKRWFIRDNYYSAKPNVAVDEDECEREFWRLVESTFEEITVEYGADLHTAQLGSGFPTPERHPDNPYSRCAWNLNNLPILPQSLFCNIRNDISGMMIPWIYVGMVFSTFCWHAEDHNTYSINYHHFGETKTWYGIPDEGADLFEETMRKTAPELFEANPDLLFHITTLLSPGVLAEKKIPVYALDQRPGEFVITFPRAYHAGFNHGFNCAEAVNFAIPDWLPFGSLSVRTYQQYRKQPVFSHEELVVSSALKNPNIDAAKWIRDALYDIIQKETDDRERVLAFIPKISIVEYSNDELISSYHQQQCRICSAFCFLSHVSCACTKQTPVCLLHATEVCLLCPPERSKLHLRCSLDYLKNLSRQVDDIATKPIQWVSKLKQFCLENERPPLKELQRFLAEGENLPGIESQVQDLRSFLTKVNAWIEKASSFLQMRKRKPANRRGTLNQESTHETKIPLHMRSTKYIQDLIEEAENLAFDCPEIHQLTSLQEQISQTQRQIKAVLGTQSRCADMDQLKFLLDQASLLLVDMPEIQELESFITQTQWYEHALYFAGHKDITLEELDKFIQEGKNIGISYPVQESHSSSNEISSEEDHILKKLEKRSHDGRVWGERATKMLRLSQVSYAELESMFLESTRLAVSKSILQDLNHRFNQVKHWIKRAQPWLDFIRVGSNEDAAATSSSSSTMTATAGPNQRRRLPGTIENLNQIIKDASQLPVYLSCLTDLPVLQEGHDTCLAWLKSCQKLLTGSISKSPPAPTLEGWLFSQLKRILSFVTAPALHNLVGTSTNKTNPDTTGQEPQLYCVCRTSDDGGLMVGCDLCGVWYHAACLKLVKKDLKSDGSYLCPVCDVTCCFPYNAKQQRSAFGSPALKGFTKASIHAWKELSSELKHICKTNGLLASLEATHTYRAIMEHLESLENSISLQVNEFLSVLVLQYKDGMQVPTQVVDDWKSLLRSLLGFPVLFGDACDELTGLIQKHAPLSRFGYQIHEDPVTTSDLSIGKTESKRERKKKADQIDSKSSTLAPEELFCFCRKRYTEDRAMIGCDKCDDWYHFDCVGLDPSAVSTIQNYVCPRCDKSKSKKKRAEKTGNMETESAEVNKSLKKENDHSSDIPKILLDMSSQNQIKNESVLVSDSLVPEKKKRKPRAKKSLVTSEIKTTSIPSETVQQNQVTQVAGDTPADSVPAEISSEKLITTPDGSSTTLVGPPSITPSTSATSLSTPLEKLPPKKRKSLMKDPKVESAGHSSRPDTEQAPKKVKRATKDMNRDDMMLPPPPPSASLPLHRLIQDNHDNVDLFSPPPLSFLSLTPAAPLPPAPSSSAIPIPMQIDLGSIDENVAGWLSQLSSSAFSGIYGGNPHESE